MASELRKQRRSSALWTLPVCYSAYVNTQEIITALDVEIARLQHAARLSHHPVNRSDVGTRRRPDRSYFCPEGALKEIASGRGQTLAQMTIAWVLRDRRVSSTLSELVMWSTSTTRSMQLANSSSRSRVE
jgi:hypothetical protein